MNPKSILATLTEIEQAHKALGLPVEEDEFLEAWACVCRMEQKLKGAPHDRSYRQSVTSVSS
jgi:hypothetical protein